MRDQRLDKLAHVLVHYSTKVRKGDLVRISGEPTAIPLIEALHEAVLRAGGHPMLRIAPESTQDLFFEVASDEQLNYLNPVVVHELDTIDVAFFVWTEVNTKTLTRSDPKKQGINSAAQKPLQTTFMNRGALPIDHPNRLRWVGTLYPTIGNAQDAEMSLRQYENFVFESGHIDKPDPIAEWKRMEACQQRLVDYLNAGHRQINFKAPGTDLTVNIEGMTWINCAGQENFPDGEVFSGPNLHAADGGVNGVVRFNFPAVHNGHEVNDIELHFEKGRVVKATASKGETFLREMLDQDEGASYLGEIAIGTNYNITHYTKNTLFDEKIGGTFHAALGAGYPECGNRNQSGLHWDMMCELRPIAGRAGGTITVDGEVISRDGKFLFDGWPGNE